MWTKNNTFDDNGMILLKIGSFKIPAGRSATSIALPTYDHDPEVKLGEDQMLIL